MNMNKTAVINFRVTPEDKNNLNKLAAELCTNNHTYKYHTRF